MPKSLSLPLRLLYLAVSLVAAACVGGCGLDWDPPDATVQTPDAFRAAKPKSAPPIPYGSYWAAEFGSTELTHIVALALTQNLDIAAAVARIPKRMRWRVSPAPRYGQT